MTTERLTRPATGRQRFRAGIPPKRAAIWISLFGLAVVIGFPLYFLVLTSLRSPFDIYNSPSLLPGHLTLNNYQLVLITDGFWMNILNSAIVAVSTTVISVVVGTLAAYALTRLRFAGRSIVSGFVLYGYLTPVVLLFVPLSVVIALLHLGDSLIGLVFIYLSFTVPLSTWLILGYFRAFPLAVEEAARIDGASRMQILWRIMLPVSSPGIATAAVLTFTMAWNELFLALVFVTSPGSRTLPVAIQYLITGDVQQYGPMMAGAVLASIPVVALYYFAQRWVVNGLGAGAVKG